jgi:hypothetical protein
MAEQIQALRRQWTDRYVMVQGDRPELARFQGKVGQVKTVNCSGRALVQFEADSNRGWYDIDPAYLQVVDKPPEPQPVEKKPVAKATPPRPPEESQDSSPIG